MSLDPSIIRAAAPSVRPLLAFAVGTGARPAEYLDLDWSDVDLRGKRVQLMLKGRDGQRKIRHCDLTPLAQQALESLVHREGPVFRTATGKRYRDTGRSSGGQFKTSWAGACQRAGMPGKAKVYRKKAAPGRKTLTYERFDPDHTPYVLRHTWASWHYCIHKDLKLLQAEGGWESQDMLDVYVHLLPSAYRQDALDLLEGRVDLHFGGPAVDQRFRAIAVQSGRKTPLGRPRRATSG